MPPDNARGRARSNPSRKTERREGPWAAARAAAREAPAARSASPALSSALSHGSSPSRWGMSAAGGAMTHARRRGAGGRTARLERRRLPAAARPDDRHDLAGGHARRDPLERPDGPERAGDVLQQAPTAPRPLRCGEAPRREPRSRCASLPPRALPHRFEGSAPVSWALSQPASASPPDQGERHGSKVTGPGGRLPRAPASASSSGSGTPARANETPNGGVGGPAGSASAAEVEQVDEVRVGRRGGG